MLLFLWNGFTLRGKLGIASFDCITWSRPGKASYCVTVSLFCSSAMCLKVVPVNSIKDTLVSTDGHSGVLYIGALRID